MNPEIEQAINICRMLIGNKSIVSDEEINNAISRISVLYCQNMSENDKKSFLDKIKKELLTLYGVRLQEYQILEGKDRREPWLREFKAEHREPWNFWQRYKNYMAESKGFAPVVINQLDEMTDNILDQLFNPTRIDSIISKKGLVVGQVQSGKTANYTGLICKAADTGFNFIVVLAGVLNNLRSQTQARIDEGFLGFDTQYERAYSLNSTTKIGVGCIPVVGEEAIANSYTTSQENGDFNSRAANTAGFNFNAPQPTILVIKKNSFVLKLLNKWLEAQSAGRKIATKSLLLIDDEADNASINFKGDGGVAAINKGIRKLISKFNRSAYIGYTATPFANIFITQDDSDLFPKDFIINLKAPSNYIGPDKIFGIGSNADSDDEVLPIVTAIDDYQNFVPEKHKLNDPLPSYDDIPESLKTAIKSFILTCAIRIARGQGNKHNSMLIHVSRYQRWQNHIKELVTELFNNYKHEIEADDPTILEEFKLLFEGRDDISFRSVTLKIANSKFREIDNHLKLHDWTEIKPLLYNAVQKIVVKSVNGSSKDVLDYQLSEKKGLSVIAIGGDKLSRGLTLEGLSVSYFLRASKMYDTLMQMGRWFGYRPGYVDLCRLYTSRELNSWFQHIAIASEELREEFDYLAESGSTPDNFALKVRTHPGNLQITSAGKLGKAKLIQVSWAARLIETYQLPMDKAVENRNLIATQNLLNYLGEDYVIKRHNYLWLDINYEAICNFLDDFTLASSLKKVNLKLIKDYIRELNSVYGELTNWSVVLMNKTKAVTKDDKQFQFDNGIKVTCFKRRRANDVENSTYFIRKNHIVGNPQDEFIDLDEIILSKALNVSQRKNKNWSKKYPMPIVVRQEFRPKNKPLLIIYPLDPTGANIINNTTKEPIGPIIYTKEDKPIIGFAISFPTSNSNKAIEYMCNMETDFAESEDEYYMYNDE